MGELPAQATGGDPGRPPHDARVGHPAVVHLALPALEGGVARHRPAPGVVVVGQRAPDLAHPVVQLVGAGRVEVGEPDVVDGAVGAALGAGPVVRHHDDHRVVELAQLGQEVEDPAQLLVGIGQEGGEALHERARHRPLPLVELRPRRHPSGRADSSVSPGTMPSARWRANARSRHASQPSSKRPRYRSIHSAGAWCGEWQAPVHSTGRTAGRRRPPAGRPGTRWPGRPGRRSGGTPPPPIGAAGRNGCRGRAPARTGGSPPRGTRTSGRSRGPRARWRGSGHVGLVLGGEVPLADRVGGVAHVP